MEDIFDKILAKIKELSIRYKYIIFVVFAISIGIYILDYIKEEEPIDISQYYNNSSPAEETEVIVHIEGAINNPGVYELPAESRVNDVIQIAGGLTQEAITKNINLARRVNDGEKIYIYKIGEEDIAKGDISQNSGKINVNNATKEQLLTLPGIGNSTATKILQYIKDNGRLKNIEDIKNISGIGDSKYEAIKDLIDIK